MVFSFFLLISGSGKRKRCCGRCYLNFDIQKPCVCDRDAWLRHNSCRGHSLQWSQEAQQMSLIGESQKPILLLSGDGGCSFSEPKFWLHDHCCGCRPLQPYRFARNLQLVSSVCINTIWLVNIRTETIYIYIFFLWGGFLLGILILAYIRFDGAREACNSLCELLSSTQSIMIQYIWFTYTKTLIIICI